MPNINRIGNQNIFTQVATEQESNFQKESVVPERLPSSTQSQFEKPKSPNFLDQALAVPAFAPGFRKELFTEDNVNKFIQSKVEIQDQIGIARNLKTWIKSNFRLHSAQERTVNNLTQTDLQTAETAATRATELNTKIKVKLGGTTDQTTDDNNFDKQKQLQMEQNNESIFLKFSGCEQELMQQLQSNIRNKQLVG